MLGRNLNIPCMANWSQSARSSDQAVLAIVPLLCVILHLRSIVNNYPGKSVSQVIRATASIYRKSVNWWFAPFIFGRELKGSRIMIVNIKYCSSGNGNERMLSWERMSWIYFIILLLNWYKVKSKICFLIFRIIVNWKFISYTCRLVNGSRKLKFVWTQEKWKLNENKKVSV